MVSRSKRAIGGNGTQGVQSVEIAARILEAFTVSEPVLGVTQIGERLGMSKSKVHRFLVSLQRVGFVRRDPHTDRYSLGLRLSSLGQLAISGLDVLAEAKDVARQLAHTTRLSASVAVWTNEGPGISYVVSPHGEVSAAYTVGTVLSFHASAHGKLFLAYASPELEDRVVFGTLRQFTRHTVTDPQKLKLQLDAVRRERVSVSRSEFMLGLFEVASPVFTATGEMITSLGVGGLSEDISVQREGELRQTVRTAAAALSGELGWQPDCAASTGAARPPVPARRRKPRPDVAADLAEPAAAHHSDLQVSFDP